MGKQLEPATLRDGFRVFWDGLELQELVSLTDEERRTAESSFPRKVRKSSWWAEIITAFFAIPAIRELPFLQAIVACALLVGVMNGLVRVFVRLQYRYKQVFKGDAAAVPISGPLRKAMRRFGLAEGEIVADVLSDNTLLALNGRPLGRRIVIAKPVTLPEIAYRGDSGQLSDAERLELKVSLESACQWQMTAGVLSVFLLIGVVAWAFTDRTLAAVAAATACLASALAACRWWLASALRLHRDAQEGELEVVGNKRVLRHSRKPWTVAGRPADWRRAYLANRESPRQTP